MVVVFQEAGGKSGYGGGGFQEEGGGGGLAPAGQHALTAGSAGRKGWHL